MSLQTANMPDRFRTQWIAQLSKTFKELRNLPTKDATLIVKHIIGTRRRFLMKMHASDDEPSILKVD